MTNEVSILYALWPWRGCAAPRALCSCSCVQRWPKSGGNSTSILSFSVMELSPAPPQEVTHHCRTQVSTLLWPPPKCPSKVAAVKPGTALHPWQQPQSAALRLHSTLRPVSPAHHSHTGLLFPSADRQRPPGAVPLPSLLLAHCFQPGWCKGREFPQFGWEQGRYRTLHPKTHLPKVPLEMCVCLPCTHTFSKSVSYIHM